ncbi:MAG: 3-hydroxyacyl-CoA dehydrogenase NAD-binding domain-containing protein, partial [Pseudomonadota bacterium]
MADIKTIGVVGAGQMGNGIAHVCALAGYDVILNDISQDALDKGISVIEKNLGRQLSRELITVDEMKSAQSRIKTSVEIGALEMADLAIEAATENREVKEKIFAGLCDVVPSHAYLATNTSSISVTRLASTT